MPAFHNLAGQTFGRLTVVSREAGRRVWWQCVCTCGKTTAVISYRLLNGTTKSCGCLRTELRTKHGLAARGSKDPLYHALESAHQRCVNTRHPSWRNYGGRGIKWRFASMEEAVAAALRTIGPRPPGKWHIDRVDNDGHYEEENLRWASCAESVRNSRRAKPITFRGRSQVLIAWAGELRISYDALRWRLRSGWSVERAFTTPPRTS